MAFDTRLPDARAGANEQRPAADIGDLLQRRSDLSTFLLHFTRDQEAGAARSNLLSILRDRRIEARSAHGMMRAQAESSPALAETQRCVCLTETPIEHAWMMCCDIASRAYQFSPYGLAFPKSWARRIGANPVWYLDITPGHDWLTKPINALIEISMAGESRGFVPDGRGEQILGRVSPEQSQVAQIAPFIEQMGTHNGMAGYRKEFWWEREWRKVGSLSFSWSNVVAVFAPADDHTAFAADAWGNQNTEPPNRPPLLDPSWGLGRMISALRGISPIDAGPLP